MSPPEDAPAPQVSSPGPAYVDLRSIEFTQRQPLDMPASEVVQRARDAGLELDLSQVYRIRERDRQRAERANREQAAASLRESGAGDSGGDVEQQENPVAQDPATAPKRRGRKPGGVDTKAGFVRSLPADLPIAEVISQGQEKGFELSEAYIRAIRSKQSAAVEQAPRQTRKRRARAEAEAAPEPVAAPTRAAAAPPAAPSPQAPPLFEDLLAQDAQEIELEFARLVARIGLLRAERILDRFKNQLSSLLQDRSASPPAPLLA